MDERHRRELRFLATLQHEVGLVVVLRGHLYVEGAIEELMLAKVPGSEAFLTVLQFARKLDVAMELGVVTPECAQAVRALNKIRNDFAHDLEREDLSAADDRRMKGALSARLAAKARECVSGDPDHFVGGWTRAGIAATYSDLRHALVALLVEQKGQSRSVGSH